MAFELFTNVLVYLKSEIDDLLADKSDTTHAHTHASTTGQTANDHHAQSHAHDASAADAPKLTQANSHESPDTDAAAASLHHTIGTAAAQAAAGDHSHASPVSVASNTLSGNVALTNANQFYDGPSLTLAAGTWIIGGTVGFTGTSTGGNITAKLWDGTTTFDSAEATNIAGNTFNTLSLLAVVSPAASTTYKISAACTKANSGSMRAAVADNSPGNYASIIYAVKIKDP